MELRPELGLHFVQAGVDNIFPPIEDASGYGALMILLLQVSAISLGGGRIGDLC